MIRHQVVLQVGGVDIKDARMGTQGSRIGMGSPGKKIVAGFFIALSGAIAGAAAYAAEPLFGPLVSNSGSYPWSVAAADFNSDGKKDIAVADVGHRAVVIQLGKGDGTFGVPTPIYSGTSPDQLRTAELAGDGTPYLLITDDIDNIITVLRSRGDGTFELADVLHAAAASRIRVFDYDGDGDLDVASVPINGPTLTLFRGWGNGSFRIPTTVTVTNGRLTDMGSADLNGDGVPDLVLSDAANAQLLVYLASGPGIFLSPTVLSIGPLRYPESFQLVRNRATGNIDIVSEEMNFNIFLPDSRIDVFGGNGDGTFNSPLGYEVTDVSPELVSTDVSGDGIPDLVLANPDVDSVSVLIGTEDDAYIHSNFYRTGFWPLAVVVADVDGDSKPDLLVSNAYADSVTTLLNQGGGTFPAVAEFLRQDYGDLTSQLYGPYDLDGDGRLDFVQSTFRIENGQQCSYDRLVSIGAPGNMTTRDITPCMDGRSIAGLQDMNADGKPDLLLRTGGNLDIGVGVAYGNGDGTFGTMTNYFAGHGNSDRIWKLVPIDFNGDGRMDIVVFMTWVWSTQSGFLVFEQQPDGSFALAGTYHIPDVVAFADFDRDGYEDLVVDSSTDASRSFQVYYGKSDGTFRISVPYPIDVYSTSNSIVQDMNGDGWPDLAQSSSHGFRVYLNKGNGSLSTVFTDYSTGGFCNPLTLSDMDGDGNVDVICVGVTTGVGDNGVFTVAYGRGDGTFVVGHTFGHLDYDSEDFEFPPRIYAGDFNGDGKADLAINSRFIHAWESLSTEDSYFYGLGIFFQRPSLQPLVPIAMSTVYFLNMDNSLDIPLQVGSEGGGPFQVNVLSGPDGGTWSLVGEDGGTLHYSPDHHYYGPADIHFTATNSAGTSNTGLVRIMLIDTNHAPAIAASSHKILVNTSFSGSVSATDADGDVITYSLPPDPPPHGAITAFDSQTGAYTYRPEHNYHGQTYFNFNACDWEKCTIGWVSFTVKPPPPTALGGTLAVNRNTPVNGRVYGKDTDRDPLSFRLKTAPAHGKLTFGSDGRYQYAPAKDFAGSDSFTFIAVDASVPSSPATIHVTVTEHAPVAQPWFIELSRTQTKSGHVSGVDPDKGDTLTYILGSRPKHGKLTFSKDGTYKYTADSVIRGSDSFTFRVSDGTKTSSWETVPITVW